MLLLVTAPSSKDYKIAAFLLRTAIENIPRTMPEPEEFSYSGLLAVIHEMERNSNEVHDLIEVSKFMRNLLDEDHEVSYDKNAFTIVADALENMAYIE